MNIIGSKWVFKAKLKDDGTLDRLKARLIAKGYHQVDGINYVETFSPVIKPGTIRLVQLWFEDGILDNLMLKMLFSIVP